MLEQLLIKLGMIRRAGKLHKITAPKWMISMQHYPGQRICFTGVIKAGMAWWAIARG
jgi:hypothetical protein